MSNQEILFIAYREEPLDEGISYAIYLSRLLKEPIRIVLLNRQSIGEKFNDLMSAVTFAEAGEAETAMRMSYGGINEKEAAAIQKSIIKTCEDEEVKASVHIGSNATITLISNFLEQKKIDIVLLSPNVTNNRSVLNKLLKVSPRPIVTMAGAA